MVRASAPESWRSRVLSLSLSLKADKNFITNSSKIPRFANCSGYIEMAECPPFFLRATSPPKTIGHCISRLLSMMPWFFSCDNINHARYGTVYIIDMFNLPRSNPVVYSKFCEGKYVVQRQSMHGFFHFAGDIAIH